MKLVKNEQYYLRKEFQIPVKEDNFPPKSVEFYFPKGTPITFFKSEKAENSTLVIANIFHTTGSFLRIRISADMTEHYIADFREEAERSARES